jgi:hypothetical protein
VLWIGASDEEVQTGDFNYTTVMNKSAGANGRPGAQITGLILRAFEMPRTSSNALTVLSAYGFCAQQKNPAKGEARALRVFLLLQLMRMYASGWFWWAMT